MSAIDGVSWDSVWAGREVATIDGVAVPFIGRQEFLANKRAAGWAKDLANVEALEGLQ